MEKIKVSIIHRGRDFFGSTIFMKAETETADVKDALKAFKYVCDNGNGTSASVGPYNIFADSEEERENGILTVTVIDEEEDKEDRRKMSIPKIKRKIKELFGNDTGADE